MAPVAQIRSTKCCFHVVHVLQLDSWDIHSLLLPCFCFFGHQHPVEPNLMCGTFDSGVLWLDGRPRGLVGFVQIWLVII